MQGQVSSLAVQALTLFVDTCTTAFLHSGHMYTTASIGEAQDQALQTATMPADGCFPNMMVLSICLKALGSMTSL